MQGKSSPQILGLCQLAFFLFQLNAHEVLKLPEATEVPFE